MSTQSKRRWEASDCLIEVVYWPITIAAWTVILLSIPFFFHGGFLVGPITAYYWDLFREFRDDWHADEDPTAAKKVDHLLDTAPVLVYGPHSFNGFGGTPSKGNRILTAPTPWMGDRCKCGAWACDPHGIRADYCDYCGTFLGGFPAP